jgi:hypothetical protein
MTTEAPAKAKRKKKTLAQQIEDCPKAVQEHIADLQMQAENAQGAAEEALGDVAWRLQIAGLWHDVAVQRMAAGQDGAALRALRAENNLRWTEDVLWSDGVPT